MKVKIIGAGSIGNHLANAARSMNWSVDVSDIDKASLQRMKNDIYPSRYGAWDDKIVLYNSNDIPKGIYDIIMIGTPPDTHLNLALAAIDEKPKLILVEKPLCTPSLENADILLEEAKDKNVQILVGYDHTLSKVTTFVIEYIKNGQLNEILTMDVNFREHWQGIFDAHPWLKGPEDTYLGYWQRGGGALGEHSHALNLWQYLSESVGKGRVTEVTAAAEYKIDGKAEYDSQFHLLLKTEKNFIGRVTQDVITQPISKEGFIQFKDGSVCWNYNHKKNLDRVEYRKNSNEKFIKEFPKTRPEDFIQEMKHLESVLNGTEDESPLSLRRGLDTMLVIAAAHKAVQEKRTIKIDYKEGYSLKALK